MTNHSLNILVCGSGSIANRHISNLLSLGVRVSAFTSSLQRSEELSNIYNIQTFTDVNKGLKTADAVVVATATDRHINLSLLAATEGKAIFVEKPLSHTKEGVADLLKMVVEKQLIVEIGCQLRAHPNLRYLFEQLNLKQDGPLYTFRAVVGQSLNTWRPGTNYKKAYSSNSERGGGALFDLIHEIDLIIWLLGEIDSVQGELSTISHLNIDADDLVNLIFNMKNGASGQVQLDMLSPVYRRGFELVFRDAIYKWNYLDGILTREDSKGKEILHKIPNDFERNDLFLFHMKHFLSRLTDNTIVPLCSLEDGVGALNVALTSKESSRLGQRIDVKENLQ